jgi:hypothetical protein
MAADALNRVAEAGGFDDLLEIHDVAERQVYLYARVSDFIGDPERVSWIIDEERTDVPVMSVRVTVNAAGQTKTKWKKHGKGTMSIIVKRFILFYARKAFAHG